jgi:hypothetical protein
MQNSAHAQKGGVTFWGMILAPKKGSVLFLIFLFSYSLFANLDI